ncbi:GAF and ANTAR domain-containing protein [Tsukamurella conjunctivitidis]|uniref:GAF and ANTAR domain-containing protein n=1 Tax=Tsukamurella conjunctivitidis TaxID=2592068 RepID=A0A5C5RW88_9ACTN|nr:GAF and ANTAR domain-containing protein [Tsukamurella conjunctivitidis]TWS26828.1 GAF and ANTAR domain-containing protein [Tsukamurella conjunctivitidis]
MAVHSRKQSSEQLPSVLGVVHESPEVPLEELTLSERMGEIARLLREQSSDSESLLTAATQFAVDQVPGADFACVTLVDPKGGISHPVVIGEEAQRVADVQRDLEEGPSVGATFESTTILLLEDTSTDDRWPRFASAAHAAGVGSILSFCLYVQNEAYGTLDLMAREPHAFDAESISIGSLYAVHAAVAFSAVREKEQIRAALTTRDVIGQAKGMIMERYKLDSDAAFRLLARLSQDSNVRLAEVAEQVIEAGPE